MEFTIYKIASLRDEDEIEAILEYFGVEDLNDIELDELGEYLVEEHHHEDLEDYKHFECGNDELESEEVGQKVDPDADDEGYLVLLTSKSVALRYFKRSDYL